MFPLNIKLVGPVINIPLLYFLKFNLPPNELTSIGVLALSMKIEATLSDADPHERVSPTPFSYVRILILFFSFL